MNGPLTHSPGPNVHVAVPEGGACTRSGRHPGECVGGRPAAAGGAGVGPGTNGANGRQWKYRPMVPERDEEAGKEGQASFDGN